MGVVLEKSSSTNWAFLQHALAMLKFIRRVHVRLAYATNLGTISSMDIQLVKLTRTLETSKWLWSILTLLTIVCAAGDFISSLIVISFLSSLSLYSCNNQVGLTDGCSQCTLSTCNTELCTTCSTYSSNGQCKQPTNWQNLCASEGECCVYADSLCNPVSIVLITSFFLWYVYVLLTSALCVFSLQGMLDVDNECTAM